MNRISNNIQPTSKKVETPVKKLNFRATAPLAQHDEMDYFIKSQKQAKKQQNLNTGILYIRIIASYTHQKGYEISLIFS